MIVKYKSSVFTQGAGWRGIKITARVEPNATGKMGEVKEILEIDGEPVQANMSRTGANRQKYFGFGIASREEGLKKRLSSCEIIETEEI